MTQGLTPLTGPTAILRDLLAANSAWGAWLTATAGPGQVVTPASRIHRVDVQRPDRPFALIGLDSATIERRQAAGVSRSTPAVVASTGTLLLGFEALRDHPDGGDATLDSDVEAFEGRVEEVLVELLRQDRPPEEPHLVFELLGPTAVLTPELRPDLGDVLQIQFRVQFQMP
jgi:hypothetical protein